MDEKQISLMKKSLHTAADQLKANARNDRAFSSCVNSILKTMRQDHADLSALNESEISNLIRFYRSLVSQATAFADQINVLPLTNEERSLVESLQREANNFERLLTKERDDIERLRDVIARISADLDVAKSTNRILADDLEGLQEAYEAEKAKEKNYRDDLKRYSSDVTERLKIENQKLSDQVARLQMAYDQENAKKDELQKQLDDLNARIAEQPTALRALEDAYTALSEKLRRIQNAQTECSKERQQELQKQIDDLEPQVDALRKEYAAIQENLSRVNEACTLQMEDTAAAEEALLERMNSAVDDLKTHSASLADRLRSAIDRCTEFEKNLKLCRSEYDRYHNWMNSEVPVLEAMRIKAGLSEQEYANLYATMNPAQCETVQLLMQRTEENLRQIDRILSVGMEAVSQDQRTTQTRAELGDSVPAARTV